MKEMKHWMSVTILTCSLAMTSCVEEMDNQDNPSGGSDLPSAVDKGRWWLDESYMDKTVKPGDDFYMYCIGTWWKNTTIPANYMYVDGFNNAKPTFTERVASLTNDNYKIFRSHLKLAEDGSEAAIAARKAYDDMLAKSGMNDAKTKADVMRAYGKMIAMGANACIRLIPFCNNGKICLWVRGNMEIFTDNSGTFASTRTITSQPSIEEIVKENPGFLSHLVPLGDKSRTRGISNQNLAIKYIIEGMGFDPDKVYMLGDDIVYGKVESSDKEFNSIIDMWTNIYNEEDVKTLKSLVNAQLSNDYGLISKNALQEFMAKILPEDKEEVADSRMDLRLLEQDMENTYMPYLRSKMVADQLVPKGLKEEYLPLCQELKAVFAQRLKDNPWLSAGSKQVMLEKLDNMIFNVGYPDHWIAEGLPDFSKSKSLLEDIYIFRKAHIDLLKAIDGKSRNQEAFTITAMSRDYHLGVDNAIYNLNYNSMNVLPYYILPPFFEATQSIAINYALARVMSHEMSHGFDNDGVLYDKYGDYKDESILASPADKTEFDRRKEQLVKWYNSLDLLPDEMPGKKADGEYTLAENIADLGGLEIAYQAFLNRLKADGYTGDQLKLMKQRFFLAYAERWRAKYNASYVNYYVFGRGRDRHSMNKERVNGVVTNMDGWYDAFDIKEGALYRKPADRIKIW